MRYRLAGACWVIALATSAAAQESDSQQILNLLKGMNQRLDGIEQRLGTVEQGSSGSAVPPEAPAAAMPAASAPAAPAGEAIATQSPPAGKAVPGWRVDVFPMTDEGISKSLIARTSAPIGETRFDLHFDGGPVSNLVNYHGEAFFFAREAGNYTFSIVLDNSKANGSEYWSCEAAFHLEDNEIIPHFSSNAPRTMSGNIDLQAGNYAASYDVSCRQRNNGLDYVLSEHEIERSYKKLAFDIKVLPPNEMKLRDFEPDELFFIAPPEKRRSQAAPEPVMPRDQASEVTAQPELAYAPPQPAAASKPTGAQAIEAGGRTTAIANLRDGPSKQAATFIRLPPNLSLYVVEQVGDWYRVQLSTGDVGFVHQSLIDVR